MKYAVTGASGFVGSALTAKLLRDGHQVVALERDAMPRVYGHTVRGELEDLRACERLINEHQPDVVYHLAAQAIVGQARRDPHATFESNVKGTYNILEAFRRHRKQGSVIIVASSDKAYGELPHGKQAYSESDPLVGRGPYDVSKSCTDLIAQSYGISYDLAVGIVRAGNIYGPEDSDLTRIIPSVIADLKDGRVPTIRSDGTPIRDYLYINDAVSGYQAVEEFLLERMNRPAAGNRAGAFPFNISGGEPVSVVDLVQMMMELAGVKGLPTITNERRFEINCQVLSCEKAHVTLGWLPNYGLREGLRLTMAACGIYTNR